MRVVAIWASLFLAQSSRFITSGLDIQDGLSASWIPVVINTGVKAKRGNVAEPSCEELLAMWRFSKRQSKTSELTNKLPIYRDPFSYNIWETYSSQTSPSHNYGRGMKPLSLKSFQFISTRFISSTVKVNFLVKIQ